MTTPFIHLRVHSAYSLAEGALPVKGLVKTAGKLQMPALAITDRNNLFGALEFSETMAGAGLQPLTGCTLSFYFEGLGGEENSGVGLAGAPAKQGDIVLIVKNKTGYHNLLKILSHAYLSDKELEEPLVPDSCLAQYCEGLIVLSGGPDGVIDVALREGEGRAGARHDGALKEIAPDHLYIELQRHGLDSEKKVEPALVELAYDLDLPIVATNQCFFPGARGL